MRILADLVINFTDADLTVTALVILWVSAIASAVVDNIPFVATMIPVIKSMAPTFEGRRKPHAFVVVAGIGCLSGR